MKPISNMARRLYRNLRSFAFGITNIMAIGRAIAILSVASPLAFRHNRNKKPKSLAERVEVAIKNSLLRDDTGPWALPNPEIELLEDERTWVVTYASEHLKTAYTYIAAFESFFSKFEGSELEEFTFIIKAENSQMELEPNNLDVLFNELLKQLKASEETGSTLAAETSKSDDSSPKPPRRWGFGAGNRSPEVTKDCNSVLIAISADESKSRSPLSRHI